MLIKTLVEDTSVSDEFKNEHGLSLYIETKKHKILFDLGASDLFLENAKKKNVNIKDIDLVIISHGHYDHGGGLEAFLQENNKANLYIHKDAFKNYRSMNMDGSTRYVGLDKKLESNERIILTEDYLYIDEELELFSHIGTKDLRSDANTSLFLQEDNELVQDTFSHEQNLIISQGEKSLLIGGCAHRGIVNIVKEFISLKGKSPSLVISGFHLFNFKTNQSEDSLLVEDIGNFLLGTDSLYYTGHCTGLDAYKELKEIMKDKIKYLSTGTIINL